MGEGGEGEEKEVAGRRAVEEGEEERKVGEEGREKGGRGRWLRERWEKRGERKVGEGEEMEGEWKCVCVCVGGKGEEEERGHLKGGELCCSERRVREQILQTEGNVRFPHRKYSVYLVVY